MVKQCVKCKINKDISCFYIRKENNRPASWCKDCTKLATLVWASKNKGKRAKSNRDYDLRQYGLTVETYQILLESQNGRCYLCERSDGDGRGKHLHVDHDHRCCPGKKSCGKCIRGLLCWHCNTGLSRFQDSPFLLRKAADYLELNNNCIMV